MLFHYYLNNHIHQLLYNFHLGLLNLTKGVEQVSSNHNKIMETLCVDESSEEEDDDYESDELVAQLANS